MGAYDSVGNLSDINVTRLIPANAEVTLALTAPPEVKNTKADGSGSPFIEAVFVVKGGAYDGAELKSPFWMGTTVKEGKKQSAFDNSRRQLKGMLFAYVPIPAPVIGADGNETPESKAARAPGLQKVDGFFKGCTSQQEIAQRISTLAGKGVKARIGVETRPPKVEGGRPFTSNVIAEFVAAAA